MAMAEKFDSLEEHLEKFVENIRQLGIIVSDFQPSSQAGLNQKLNFMVTGLQDIDKCRQQLHDISVPLEVFEYIDQGRNPQLYTKECLERALAKNEQVKGKIDTMKKFKSLLIQELTKVFPEDMAKYKAIRVLRPSPSHDDLSEIIKSGFTTTLTSSLSTCGYIPPGRIDLCTCNLFKCFLTSSSSTKGQEYA
uniref:Mediator of RNA polymerase II transcription subunit 10 n=1 Tax=Apteryx owenii TaxID=8824 RepID=A0A8B9P4J2_APTOW